LFKSDISFFCLQIHFSTQMKTGMFWETHCHVFFSVPVSTDTKYFWNDTIETYAMFG
jgi:hypothetical protein